VLDGVRGAEVRVLPVHDRRHLPRFGVLRDVRARGRRDEAHACDLVAVVADLVAALRAGGKRDDVALRQGAVPVVHPHGRCSAEDDEQLLRAVVEVVDELRRSRLQLPHRCPEAVRFRANESPGADATPVGDLVPDVRGVTHAAIVVRG
jgi:hypothetical protein